LIPGCGIYGPGFHLVKKRPGAFVCPRPPGRREGG
jgi:hypothetical protein